MRGISIAVMKPHIRERLGCIIEMILAKSEEIVVVQEN
jgi:hypothetical protein